jgi:hypothetical protein
MSNHLTYTIDLDYLNVDNIQTYITFLQSLIENERKVEEERLQSRIKLTDSKPNRKLLSIIDENDDKVETSDLETQTENESLEPLVTNDLSTKTKAQLSELCKLKDIKHTSKTTKNKLIELLNV